MTPERYRLRPALDDLNRRAQRARRIAIRQFINDQTDRPTRPAGRRPKPGRWGR